MASSSDSSEAEDLEKFAVITDIVNSEVVKFNGSFHSSAKCKPSLRHWRKDEDVACSTSELITPEFRHHVAKKLSKHLDKSYICTQEAEHLQNGHDNSSHESPGIRLLLSSNERLLQESLPSSTVSKRNQPNAASSSDSDTDEEELNRLAEAAVSGYSIILKCEGSNGSREQVEGDVIEMNGVKRKKEKKKKKKEKRKETKVDEEQKEKKHKKHKKEKYKEKT